MGGAYERLVACGREIANLSAVGSLLGWDQETYMPAQGSAGRSEQAALLARIEHEHRTAPALGELICECESDASLMRDGERAASVREFRRSFELATKLPSRLVEELARTGTRAQEAWKEARKKSDFAMFAPWLGKMTALTREKASCYGTPAGGEAYDALLNEYEPNARAREIEAVFTPLGKRLSTLIDELRSRGRAPDTSLLNIKAPERAQHELGQFMLKSMGFDLGRGRLDVTTHPFCSGLAPGDTRLTTRYREERFTDALYGTMHEMGHGLYEQGLPKSDGEEVGAKWGTPLADSISLGIHESQSRMWENMVGRSREFWEWALPHVKRCFGGAGGDALAGATPEVMFRAVNTASPSFIRVEADETTYNLHILIRFEVERALFNGALEVAGVPSAWNAAYKKYLGLDVPDDRRGCLQDVHWSAGLVGYFPTYTFGNLYAAQFWEAMARDLPKRDTMMSKGEFAPILSWLRESIHAHGRRYSAEELCKRVTGQPLSHDALLRHLARKVSAVYGV